MRNEEIENAERTVFGNVCRCCDREIEHGLTVNDLDDDDWPRCNECAAKANR